ncbi:MAG: hypothetical protein U0401_02435 [Anaerolineae bacterium]
MADKLKESAIAYFLPPKMVQNERGEIVEVILSYTDYQTFLRFLVDYVDWELLPSHLQDAVDRLLAEEAKGEQGDESPTPMTEALAKLGINLNEDATP